LEKKRKVKMQREEKRAETKREEETEISHGLEKKRKPQLRR
jgi:hypothetical protein